MVRMVLGQGRPFRHSCQELREGSVFLDPGQRYGNQTRRPSPLAIHASQASRAILIFSRRLVDDWKNELSNLLPLVDKIEVLGKRLGHAFSGRIW